MYILCISLVLIVIFVFNSIQILRISSRFNPEDRSVTFTSGLTLSSEQLKKGGFGPLLDTIFTFGTALNKIKIDETELSLLSAICLITGGKLNITELKKKINK